MLETQDVCVVGLGYIGLPTASFLATRKSRVYGVDVNPKVVEKLSRGEIHIYEPDLDVLVKSAVNSGALRVGPEPKPADVFILAVPTPFQGDHKPDISYVLSATRSIASCLQHGNLVILESTSPVGTTEKIAELLQELRPDLHIAREGDDSDAGGDQVYVAHCPERVLPGQIIKELVDNDRIIGGINPASAQKAQDFYGEFVNGKILLTNARTAEMAKLVENASRDVSIAFANELSLICDKVDINVWELIGLANHHPRVNILQPGPGVGGHCIAVDPWFIIDSAPEDAKLIRTAREVNNSKPHFVVNKTLEAAAAFDRPAVACLGLSYKANVDDLRESPPIEIVEELANRDGIARLLVVEPHVQELPRALQGLPNVEFTDTDAALEQADVIVLLVDHNAFKKIDRSRLDGKTVIDTRGIWR